VIERFGCVLSLCVFLLLLCYHFSVNWLS